MARDDGERVPVAKVVARRTALLKLAALTAGFVGIGIAVIAWFMPIAEDGAPIQPIHVLVCIAWVAYWVCAVEYTRRVLHPFIRPCRAGRGAWKPVDDD